MLEGHFIEPPKFCACLPVGPASRHLLFFVCDLRNIHPLNQSINQSIMVRMVCLLQAQVASLIQNMDFLVRVMQCLHMDHTAHAALAAAIEAVSASDLPASSPITASMAAPSHPVTTSVPVAAAPAAALPQGDTASADAVSCMQYLHKPEVHDLTAA